MRWKERIFLSLLDAIRTTVSEVNKNYLENYEKLFLGTEHRIGERNSPQVEYYFRNLPFLALATFPRRF